MMMECFGQYHVVRTTLVANRPLWEGRLRPIVNRWRIKILQSFGDFAEVACFVGVEVAGSGDQ